MRRHLSPEDRELQLELREIFTTEVPQEVRDKVRQIAAHMLEAAPDDIVLEQGQYQVKGVPARSLARITMLTETKTVWHPKGML